MSAPTLFDLPSVAVARHRDPPTSHAAAQSVMHVNEKQLAVLLLFRGWGPMCDQGLIARAQTEGIVQSDSGLRTRRDELVTQGLVRDTGRTTLTRAGRKTIVWEAV